MRVQAMQVGLLAFLVTLAGCSKSSSDVHEVKEMMVVISQSIDKANEDGDVAGVQWLLGVHSILAKEAIIVKSDPEDHPEPTLSDMKNKIDLAAYNRTLEEHLTSEQFVRLTALREKHGYTSYVTPIQPE